MRFLSNLQCVLVLFLLVTLLCLSDARRGGGSRGGSRSSSRTSSSRSGTRYTDRSRSRDSAPAPVPIPKPAPAPAPVPKPPAPPPKKPPAPKPSAPEEPVVVRQPAHNPNYRESSPNQGAGNPGQNVAGNRQPPPYSPAAAPPAYSPAGQPPAGAPPAYSPAGQPPPHAPVGQPPPYSPPGPGFRPGINPPAYPQQPGMGSAPYPQQPGMRPAPYPQQPGMGSAPYPQQPGMGSAPYPQQPGMRPAPYPQQPGMGSAPYPQQPGIRPYPQQPGMGSAPYPRQPGMSYPQQPGMNRPLGSNVWAPNSGMPAPAYMNYGGLPTGGNMYGKPHKQKGFLGSLMSMGGMKHKSKNKYYGSYPGSYGGMGGGGMGMGGMGGGRGFLGKHGTSIAMMTILPYMAMRSSHSFFRPRLGFFPMFLPSPFYHHHHYGYGSGYGNSHYYDVYNENYAGKCKRPITPVHGAVQCNSTYRDTRCHVNCTEGYQFPDNVTTKDNECWHVTGVWRPTKNFPDCKPVCNETCLNGGNCIHPGVCGCSPDYRGPHCEFRKLNFLNCDVRKLAGSTKISWVCTHTKNETTCKIKCKPPTEFAVEPETEYRCTPDGVWTPNAIPECVIKDELTTMAPTAEGVTVN